ncbi:MAG: 2Fe-2S iron-sulfur cluster binding domain-containing protein [Crocinitomicaceae bacterium]|nr:2Fe-2S iron-sulfur cluster binding domain-containing protein [Crocinitomicaceae bacterium]
MTSETIQITDSFGNSYSLNYKKNEYPSLLELIKDHIITSIGDCKGRAWCGTCAVRLLKGNPQIDIETPEMQKLQEIKINNWTELRLACQIPLNSSLHKNHWEIIDSRKHM